MSRESDKRLGRFLLRERLLTEEQLERALLHPQARDEGLTGALSTLGFMTEPQVLDFLSRHFGVERVDLDEATLDWDLARVLSFEVCKRHSAVPLRLEGRTVVMAMSDPGDFHAVDEIRFRVGKGVRPVVAGRAAVRRGLRRLFPDRMTAQDAADDRVAHELRTRRLAPLLSQSPAAEQELRHRYRRGLDQARSSAQGLDDPGIRLDAEDKVVIRLCHELLYTAIAEELSHVRIELFDGGCRVLFRRDEQWHNETPLPGALRERTLWHVKDLCELPVGPIRCPLQGHARLAVSKGRYRYVRIFLLPTRRGCVVVLCPVPAPLEYRSAGDESPRVGPDDEWWTAFEAGQESQRRGSYSAAEVWFREAVAAAEEAGEAGRRRLGDALVQLALALDRGGRPGEALPMFERALEVERWVYGPDSHLLTAALIGMGDVLIRQRRVYDGLAAYRQALLKIELAFGDNDLEAVWLMSRIRGICLELGDEEEANDLHRVVCHVLGEVTGLEFADVLRES
ncbi:MAG: tetratricopeptide repeat protein [bacterium]